MSSNSPYKHYGFPPPQLPDYLSPGTKNIGAEDEVVWWLEKGVPYNEMWALVPFLITNSYTRKEAGLSARGVYRYELPIPLVLQPQKTTVKSRIAPPGLYLNTGRLNTGHHGRSVFMFAVPHLLGNLSYQEACILVRDNLDELLGSGFEPVRRNRDNTFVIFPDGRVVKDDEDDEDEHDDDVVERDDEDN